MKGKNNKPLRFLIRAFVIISVIAFGIFLGCLPLIFGCDAEWLISVMSSVGVVFSVVCIVNFNIDRRIADKLAGDKSNAAPKACAGSPYPIADAYYEYWQIYTSKSYSLKRLQPGQAGLRLMIGMIAIVSGFLFLLPFAFEDLPQEMFIISFALMGYGVGIILLGYFRGILTGLCGMALAAVIVMTDDRTDELIDNSPFAAVLLVASLLFAIGFILFLLLKKINRADFRLPPFEDRGCINIPMRMVYTSNFTVCTVTVDVDTNRHNAEKHFLINKAADIALYCSSHGMTYVGLQAVKSEPTVTYIAYCRNAKSAQKFIKHVSSSVEGTNIRYDYKYDPELGVYTSLLPDQKTLFRCYNSLFADSSALRDTERTLEICIVIPDDQKMTDFLSSDCELKFEPGEENSAEAKITGVFDIADLNRMTDELCELADRFDGVLLPWIIQ